MPDAVNTFKQGIEKLEEEIKNDLSAAEEEIRRWGLETISTYADEIFGNKDINKIDFHRYPKLSFEDCKKQEKELKQFRDILKRYGGEITFDSSSLDDYLSKGNKQTFPRIIITGPGKRKYHLMVIMKESIRNYEFFSK